MTCHLFRHHPGPNCIPLFTCHLHQGLIAHGKQLSHRCNGWTQDLHRQRGWAPEVVLEVGTLTGRRCRPARAGLAMVARCSTFGPAAGTAGLNGWR